MFYYTQDKTIIATSETKIRINTKLVKEVEIKEKIENPILEEGKIIDFKDSKKFLEEEEKKRIEEEKKIEENLQEEKKNLESIGYEVEIKDGVVVKKTTENNNKIDFSIEIEKINVVFRGKLRGFTKNYTSEEIQTWDLKVREAEKVIAGEKSNILDALIIPGRTTLELAKKVLENSAIYFKVYTDAEKEKTLAVKELEKTLFNK